MAALAMISVECMPSSCKDVDEGSSDVHVELLEFFITVHR